jgi:hypothetical protein
MAAMAAAADDYCTTGALSSFAGEPSVFLLRRHHDRDTTARTEYDGRRGSEKKRNRCRVRVGKDVSGHLCRHLQTTCIILLDKISYSAGSC